MNVIFIFVDGIGIGSNNPSFNPCCFSPHYIFHPEYNIPFGGVRFGLDACLGIKGFPQSATGQTTIYTGENAAKLIGKHLFGFPNKQLQMILSRHSIFYDLILNGYKCRFINAFRPVFFTSPEIFRNIRLSATSEMNRANNLPFATIREVKKGKALYHDFTNNELINKGFDVPQYDAETAADILIDLSNEYNLVLYEYFLTDAAGHGKNIDFAVTEIKKIESLIFNVVKRAKELDKAVIVCSDHGNIEDLRIKSHTNNPAFFAVWTNKLIKRITSLTEVKNLIIDLVNKN